MVGDAEPDQASEEAEAAVEVPSFDPFARHRDFAASRRAGRVFSGAAAFLDRLKPPVDVRADKVLDLNAFGKQAKQFVKTPRPKRADELPEGYEDRLKNDLERQFTLRNLMRYVMTVDEKDPIEWKRDTTPKLELVNARAHLAQLHKKPELLDALGYQHCRAELEWRHHMHDVMQWERYFSKEIKADFPGPLWKHDPDTNPIPAGAADKKKAGGEGEAGGQDGEGAT